MARNVRVARLFLLLILLDVVLPVPLRDGFIRMTIRDDTRHIASSAEHGGKAPQAEGQPVGAVAGTFSVDPGGVAGYEVALQVPPGTAGMVPQLSLSFSSSAGAGGGMGLGWSIKGLSGIHRCPQTYGRDGSNRPVMYDAKDLLCLDGNRLVAMNGGAYGADGTEYRTEMETFTKLVSHGASGSGPAWFEVWTSDGHYATYGSTADSRVMVLGSDEVRVWSMDRVEDRAGNYMSFTFVQPPGTGDYRLVSVNYTGNENAGVKPYNAMVFHYEDAPDVVPVFTAGSPVLTAQRLSGVETLAEGSRVLQYNVAYRESRSTGASLVTSIEQCAAATGSCLPPTTFEWNERSGEAYVEKPVALPGTTVAGSVAMASLDLSRVQFGDFDGNGLSDMYVIQGYGGEPVPGDIYLQSIGQHYTHVEAPAFPIAGWIAGAQRDMARIRLVDMNSDGRTDIYYIEGDVGSGGAVPDSVYLSNGDGTFTRVEGPATNPFQSGPRDTSAETFDLSRVRFADMNGDSVPDVYVVMGWGTSAQADAVFLSVDVETGKYEQVDGARLPVAGWLEMAQVDLARINLLDLNADGCADLYYVTGYGSSAADQIYLGNCAGSFQAQSIAGPVTNVHTGIDAAQLDISRIQFGDLNHDGFADLYYVNGGPGFSSNVDSVYYNMGNGSFDTANGVSGADTPVRGSVALASIDIGRVNLIDVDADGYLDVYYVTGWGEGPVEDVLYLGHGNGTFTQVPGARTTVSGSASLASLDLGRLRFMDWDGNGVADVYRITGYGGGPTVDEVFFNPTKLPKLERITNGLGATTNIKYLPATINTVYEPSREPVQFPERNFHGPIYVVAYVAESDGIGGSDETNYTYYGGKEHVQGWGFLGFRNVTVTRKSTGVATTNVYSQNYESRLQYHVLESEARAGEARTEHALAEWRVQQYDDGSAPRYLTYMAMSVNGQFDLDGSWLGTTTTTNSDMDSYGNFRRVQSSIEDSYGWYNTTTNNEYLNVDTMGEWVIGLVQTSNATSSAPDQAAITKHTAFGYSAEYLLTSEVIEPDSDSYRLATEYQLDLFGNRVVSTVSGSDIATRVSTAKYDKYGRFVTEQSNALEQTSSATYDSMFGSILTSTNLNGLTTTNTYNAFGQPTMVVQPDGTNETMSRRWCTDAKSWGDPACIETAQYYVRTTDSVGIPSWEHRDELDRVVRVMSVGFNGTLVATDTAYTTTGTVEKVSNAYFAGTGAPVYWTRYEYDALGRNTLVEHVDGTTSSVTYQGLKTTFTNELGQTHASYLNALGKTVRAVDESGNATTYVYDASGNMVELVDAGGNAIRWKYNVLNYAEEENDPDIGVRSLAPDVLGNVLSQTDALGQTITFAYDALGRVVKQSRPEGTSTWAYDTAAHGVGLLDRVSSYDGIEQQFTYDQYSRPNGTVTTIDGEPFSMQTTYDAYGRPQDTVYPDEFTARVQYNQYNFACGTVERGGDGVQFERVNAMDAEGRVTSVSFANGATTERVYNYTGTLLSITTAIANNSIALQQLEYTWNALGHLVERRDVLRGLSEHVTYDSVNRIASSELGDGTNKKQYAYDATGNIVLKSDVGEYEYGGNGAGPHAVSKITSGALGGSSFTYDKNGNMLTSIGRTMTYNSANKQRTIERSGGLTMRLRYDAGDNMFQRALSDGSSVTYIGGAYEIVTDKNGKQSRRHFVGADSIYTVAADTGATSDTFVHRDHLGSVDVVSDLSGKVVQRQSYDAFGSRRNPDTWQDIPLFSAAAGNVTDHGFTDHIDLTEFGLVYMNARVYDPLLGRFLTADTILQDPGDTQGPNRYSYVRNNPLTNTDPSGHGFFKKAWKKLKHAVHKIGHSIEHAFQKSAILRSVVGIALTVAAGAMCGPGAPVCAAIAQAVTQAAYAAATTKIMGGSWGDAFRSAGISLLYSAATYGAGQYFDRVNLIAGRKAAADSFGVAVGRAATHGVVGGTFSVVQGEKFGPGFVSSAFTSGLAPKIQSLFPNPAAGITAAAVLGGVSSKLSGGSFVTGAVQGATVFGLNEVQAQNALRQYEATHAKLGAAADAASGVANLAQNYAYESRAERYYENYLRDEVTRMMRDNGGQPIELREHYWVYPGEIDTLRFGFTSIASIEDANLARGIGFAYSYPGKGWKHETTTRVCRSPSCYGGVGSKSLMAIAR